MYINKKLIKFNFVKGRGNKKIEYIVIHDTGNTRAGAGANNHYLYFNGGDRQASAHYFVDDKEILQLVEDENTAWHCGDAKGKYNITNQNSIGIEICVNSDGDYSKALLKTIELTTYLMDKHNIPLDKVVRHYDASRKNCPASMSKNNWEAWNGFKIALKREIDNNSNKVKINFKGKEFKIEGYLKDGSNYVKVRDLLEAIGYKVDWNNNTKTVIVK